MEPVPPTQPERRYTLEEWAAILEPQYQANMLNQYLTNSGWYPMPINPQQQLPQFGMVSHPGANYYQGPSLQTQYYPAPQVPFYPMPLQPQPMLFQPQPIPLQPQPMLFQPQPMLFQPQPMLFQPQPIPLQPQPMPLQPQPPPNEYQASTSNYGSAVEQQPQELQEQEASEVYQPMPLQPQPPPNEYQASTSNYESAVEQQPLELPEQEASVVYRPPLPQPQSKEHDWPFSRAIVTPKGEIIIELCNMIIHITTNNSLKLVHTKANLVTAINSTGTTLALVNSVGRIFYMNKIVEIDCNTPNGDNRIAMFNERGVCFTHMKCPVVYLTDESGTKTTCEKFLNLHEGNIIRKVYRFNPYTTNCYQNAVERLRNAGHWIMDNGVDHWIIDDIQVTQSPEGYICIFRESIGLELRCSVTGALTLSLPFLHIGTKVAMPRPYLFVRSHQSRVHFEKGNLEVRYEGQGSGFNSNNELIIRKYLGEQNQ